MTRWVTFTPLIDAERKHQDFLDCDAIWRASVLRTERDLGSTITLSFHTILYLNNGQRIAVKERPEHFGIGAAAHEPKLVPMCQKCGAWVYEQCTCPKLTVPKTMDLNKVAEQLREGQSTVTIKPEEPSYP